MYYVKDHEEEEGQLEQQTYVWDDSNAIDVHDHLLYTTTCADVSNDSTGSIITNDDDFLHAAPSKFQWHHNNNHSHNHDDHDTQEDEEVLLRDVLHDGHDLNNESDSNASILSEFMEPITLPLAYSQPQPHHPQPHYQPYSSSSANASTSTLAFSVPTTPTTPVPPDLSFAFNPPPPPPLVHAGNGNGNGNEGTFRLSLPPVSARIDKPCARKVKKKKSNNNNNNNNKSKSSSTPTQHTPTSTPTSKSTPPFSSSSSSFSSSSSSSSSRIHRKHTPIINNNTTTTPTSASPVTSTGTEAKERTTFWTPERERALTRALIGYSDVHGHYDDVLDEISYALQQFKKETTRLSRSTITFLIRARISARVVAGDADARAFAKFHAANAVHFAAPFGTGRLVGLNGNKIRERYSEHVTDMLKVYARPVAENRVSLRETLRKMALSIYKKDGGLMTKRCLSEYLRTQEFGAGPQKELYMRKYMPCGDGAVPVSSSQGQGQGEGEGARGAG